MEEERVKGYPVTGERFFQSGFIIYNLVHKKTRHIQDMWMRHIHRCGIECQISLYFVAQRFPSPVISEFTAPICDGKVCP